MNGVGLAPPPPSINRLDSYAEVASTIFFEKHASELFSCCLVESSCALLSSSLDGERKSGENGG